MICECGILTIYKFGTLPISHEILKTASRPFSRRVTQRSAVKRVTSDAELRDRRGERRPPPQQPQLLQRQVAAAGGEVVKAPTARLFLRAS